MKILQVYPYFAPAWSYGGVTRVAYEISRHLVKRGHDVTVYTTDALDSKTRLHFDKNPTKVDGIETYYFRNISNFLSYKYHVPIPLVLLFKVKNDLKKFDIIHLHGYSHILSVLVVHYAKKYNIPYIIQTHGGLVADPKREIFQLIFTKLVGKKMLAESSRVIALNETEKEEYLKLGVNKNKIEIIPNGINLSEYENLPKRGKFRKKYGLNDNEKVVLYLGRLHKAKGIDLLLNSFAKVKDELDAVSLVLVGPDDGYKKELLQLTKSLNIGSKVIYTGFVSSEEKIHALIDADVFVTPKFTGFPVTFVESCACGTPIITSDEGDKLDWIDTKVGFVVDYDVSHFGEAIYQIIKKSDLRNEFSNRCKKIVREKFKWDKIVKKFENVYLNLM